MSKNNDKNVSGKDSQKFFDHVKQSAKEAFKTASNKPFQKQQKQPVISLVIKLLIKLKSQEIP